MKQALSAVLAVVVVAMAACGDDTAGTELLDPPIDVTLEETIERECPELPDPNERVELVDEGVWRRVLAWDDGCVLHRQAIEFKNDDGSSEILTHEWTCNQCDYPVWRIMEFGYAYPAPVTLAPPGQADGCLPIVSGDFLCNEDAWGGVRAWQFDSGAGFTKFGGLVDLGDAGALFVQETRGTVRLYAPRFWRSADTQVEPDVSAVHVCSDIWEEVNVSCRPERPLITETNLRFREIEVVAPAEWVAAAQE